MKTKVRFRFTIRTALIATAAVALLIGARVRVAARHNQATAFFRANGLGSDSFQDPIGPNWIYTGKSSVPRNGPTILPRSFFLTGSFRFYLWKQTYSSKQWSRLANLVHLRSLDIANSHLPPGWLSTLCDCESLRALSLYGVEIGEKEIADLSRLRVERLVLSVIRLDNASESQLVEVLALLPNATYIRLDQGLLSERQLDLLRRSLPNCEIVAFNKDAYQLVSENGEH